MLTAVQREPSCNQTISNVSFDSILKWDKHVNVIAVTVKKKNPIIIERNLGYLAVSAEIMEFGILLGFFLPWKPRRPILYSAAFSKIEKQRRVAVSCLGLTIWFILPRSWVCPGNHNQSNFYLGCCRWRPCVKAALIFTNLNSDTIKVPLSKLNHLLNKNNPMTWFLL